MRLIFLGTPEFAVPTLEVLVRELHDVVAVYTQPDRPKGRGQKPAMSPVKEMAIALGLPVFQPERIRRPEVVEELQAFQCDAMVVVGYGQIIPQSIIDLAPLGIINVHASLLPKYRGAAPIQWAVANGERVTGVTTMKINAGLDTGDMLLKWDTEIGPDETAIELSKRLAPVGAELLAQTLVALENGSIEPIPQNDAEASFAPILKKEDGLIDWHWPATKIADRVRGLQPWPGCFTVLRGAPLRIWKARPAGSSKRPPGSLSIENKKLIAACGSNEAIELVEVQAEGRKRMPAQAFLNGFTLRDNETFDMKQESPA
jgi:methionyl-tRNA formyltransferase